MATRKQIVDDIKQHVTDRGGDYSDWYVGITDDPDRRLFTDHGVKKKGDKWLHRKADSEDDARAIEKYCLEQLGFDGGGGGGDEDTRYVYIYKKNSHTDP